MKNRFERQERLFGKDGQDRLRDTTGVVVGAGGVGGFVILELALLGVGSITVIDPEELDETNKNRYPTARDDDPVPGSLKVDLAERLVKSINPKIHVQKIPFSLFSRQAIDGLIRAHAIFGGLDDEGARLVLNEISAAYEKPYIDVASDVIHGDPPEYGGRIVVNWDGQGCLVCRGLLDVAEAQAALAGESGAQLRRVLYGVDRELLGRSGPSVASINAVVASLAVTEFMVAVTGLRKPQPLLTYHGRTGKVTTNTDLPAPDCYYCKAVRGQRERADVLRYIALTVNGH